VLILAIYSYAAIKTRATTGPNALPTVFAPDVSLYLNVSQLKNLDSGGVLEPYYKIAVPPVRLGYLKFRLAFVLFGYLNSLLFGHLALTLMVWNLLWWGLLCALALWLLQRFLPDASVGIVLSGLAFLLLFNFGLLKPQVLAWLHPFLLAGFQDLQLPYIRPFFPQLPIVFLVGYIGLQIEALRRQSPWWWVAMAALQIIAFMIFPYTIVMMAGTTAVATLGQFLSERAPLRWRVLLLYAAGCGISDLIFFLHGDAVLRAGAPEQHALLHFQLSLLPHMIGGAWLFIALLTALVVISPGFAPEVRWTLAGLGVSNLIFLVGDTFFAVTSLQMSHHAGYFVQITTAILFVFLFSAAYKRLGFWSAAVRLVPAAVLLFLLINGAILTRAAYVTFLPLNRERADFARLLKSHPTNSRDLVIARSQFSDDPATWIPLLTDAETLFCRNAQYLLVPEQNRDINRFRQAMYLYFTGRGTAWLDQVLANPKDAGDLMQLAFAAQITSFEGKERQTGADIVKEEIAPWLAKVESHAPESREFFNKYRTILVVDDIKNRSFVVPQVQSYLKITSEENFGELIVLTCVPEDGT
jgi:hypothetical protein